MMKWLKNVLQDNPTDRTEDRAPVTSGQVTEEAESPLAAAEASEETVPAAQQPAAAPAAAGSPDAAAEAAVIRSSLLFDEAWYRQMYGLGEYLDAALHYLEKGWREGKDPSPLFSTSAYLADFPAVQAAGVNPLLHFEREGYAAGNWRERIDGMRAEILAQNPGCEEHLEDGFLRVRITNACNAKCRYCGVRLTFGEEMQHAMKPEWYYTHFRPLYEKVRVLLITGGDAFVAKESYPYMKFLSEEYPQVNVMTESNGIAFDERFRELACDNLFKTHFSVNASNVQVFRQGCWEEPGGAAAYEKLMGNIRAYVELLRERDRLVFAPDWSMVVNHDTAEDIVPFLRLALELHAWHVNFFFDYTENDMGSAYFGNPASSRPALRTLMELERVLRDRFFIYFRLWIPLAEAHAMQQEVEAMPLAELETKYAQLLQLAADRSVVGEFEERNRLRRAQGKKELRMEEDYLPSIHGTVRGGSERCFSPWESLDVSPNGNIGVCCWAPPVLNFNSFLGDGPVDWDAILNSYACMSFRKKLLMDNYDSCMVCCPLNGARGPVESVFRYGVGRKDEKRG